MARKKTEQPEIVIENLGSPNWLTSLKKIDKSRKIEIILIVVGLTLVLIGIVSSYVMVKSFDNQFLPGTQVDNQDISGLTQQAATELLQQSASIPHHTLELKFEEHTLSSPSAQLQPYRDFPEAITQAWGLNQQLSWWQRLQLILGLKTYSLEVDSSIYYTPQLLNSFLNQLAQKVQQDSTTPQATLGTSGNLNTLKIRNGSLGRELDVKATQESIFQALNQKNISENETLVMTPVVVTTGTQLSEIELSAARERASQFVGKRVTWVGADQRLHLSDADFLKLLTFPQGFSENGQQDIVETWHAAIERPPSPAEFEYDPTTLVVTAFVPHRDGLTLDRDQTLEQLGQALTQLEAGQVLDTLELPLALRVTASPKTLSETNDLGIKEIIGMGESEYHHSIPSRVHNVALTSSRITNHIVEPGEEFSFNKTLGTVSAATGFQPAYVIMNGQTVLGDGGGVCQVSTTLFRALLDAGVEITRRRPHSYRVTYYELNSKPGLDATVYSGEVDLRFKNDTGHHILIHSEADSQNLYMKVELYGTSDGRTTDIVDHVTWDARPAPAPVMIPDPSLPPGKRKQIDWAASGIKARFTNVIKNKDGQVVREDVYTSNYVPWSAKYLVGP